MTETTTASDKEVHTSLTTAVRQKDCTTAATTTRDIASTCREKVSERSERSGLAAAAASCSSVPSLASSVQELLRVGRQALGCGHLWGHVLDDGCHGDRLQVRQEEKRSRTSSHPQRYKRWSADWADGTSLQVHWSIHYSIFCPYIPGGAPPGGHARPVPSSNYEVSTSCQCFHSSLCKTCHIVAEPRCIFFASGTRTLLGPPRLPRLRPHAVMPGKW